MQAHGPLMIEHRLIEEMLKAIKRILEHVAAGVAHNFPSVLYFFKP